ncbi:uncharacterized protein KGF55_004887 [Candida pseudojiufengensis]|uniref:uncharacterized protein n=1 Tax=Candida pseudojiufengensis TaxID=497109 RepID=UPI00222467F2|nr:uncharacterized protein KGF55_004887 [Candida pseudojiufengensis]KAI5960164.1 hypothetical protein KGF55_004887 [Candida pseudojiufengensis]
MTEPSDDDTDYDNNFVLIALIAALPFLIGGIILCLVACVGDEPSKKSTHSRTRPTRDTNLPRPTRDIILPRPQAAHLKFEDNETLIDSESCIAIRNLSDLESAETKVN